MGFLGASGFSDSLAPWASGCHSPMSRPGSILFPFRTAIYSSVFLMLQELLVGTTSQNPFPQPDAHKPMTRSQPNPLKPLTRSNSQAFCMAPTPHKRSNAVESRSLGDTLRGTMRAKLASQLRKSMMKGQQDYSLPRAAVTSRLQYQFMTAVERDLVGHQENTCQQARVVVLTNLTKFPNQKSS